jgi:RNA polymerase-binding transcription factor DksA
MNARRRSHFETLLLQERARAASVMRGIAAAGVTNAHDPALLIHGEAGAGAAGAGPDDDAAVAVRETVALAEIDAVLRLLRVDPELYGTCVHCGRPIPDARLEILPATRLCERHAGFEWAQSADPESWATVAALT